MNNINVEAAKLTQVDVELLFLIAKFNGDVRAVRNVIINTLKRGLKS